MTLTVSRRMFLGGMAATVGYLGLNPSLASWAAQTGAVESASAEDLNHLAQKYDALAKLGFNENPYGPSESVIKAMAKAFKYANRYEPPDGGIIGAIAAHHGVNPDNVMLGNGSTEILEAADNTFLQDHKKVVGVEPTYGTVYEWALGLKSDAIRLPLRADHRQDIPAIIKATKDNYPNVGFVYICNPNNPTGIIVTKKEIRQLLDAIPHNIPVLIDEAYHHFVEDPNYGTSVPYVLEGRPVIVARTFSKIGGLAGMRLGYCLAPRTLIEQMHPHISAFNVNAIVKWGGVESLRDTAGQAKVKGITLQLRKKTTTKLQNLGYDVLPSETNFFMVHIRRPVKPVIEEFRKRSILVGRPFPPMLDYLRVSVGTADEMQRFMAAFGDIFLTSAHAQG